MKTHNEFIKEVIKKSTPPTIAERTHDALSEGYKQGGVCKSCRKFIGNSIFCKECNNFNKLHDGSSEVEE